MRITLSDDRSRIHFDGGIWQHTIPVEDLPRWLKMYRDLRDRKAPRDKKQNITGPGPYHDIHGPIVGQLERIQRDLGQRR